MGINLAAASGFSQKSVSLCRLRGEGLREMLLKHTPLTRLTDAFEKELDLAKDERLESTLAKQYLLRLGESQAKRDATFKAFFFIDVILSVAITGKNTVIPGTTLSTADFPALIEIILGVSSICAYMASFTFCAWLCYSQVEFVFVKRKALKKGIDPDLIAFSEILSEPTLKMLRKKFNIWGVDWITPSRPFSAVAITYSAANALFFLVIPVVHFALVYAAMKQLVITRDFSLIYGVYYFWVIMSNFLALFIWFVPHIWFSFTLDDKPKESSTL